MLLSPESGGSSKKPKPKKKSFSAGAGSTTNSYKAPSYYNPPRDNNVEKSVSGINSLLGLSSLQKPQRKPQRRQLQQQSSASILDVLRGIEQQAMERQAGRPTSAFQNMFKAPEPSDKVKPITGLTEMLQSPMEPRRFLGRNALERNAQMDRNFLTDINGKLLDLEALQKSDLAPLGAEPDLPKRWLNQGNRKNANLKWWWDQEFINERLSKFGDDPFRTEWFLSDVLDKRYKDKENFAFNRVNNRRDTMMDALQQAMDGLYNTKAEGGPDFDVLEREFGDLEFDIPRYREEYGRNMNKLYRRDIAAIEGISDDYTSEKASPETPYDKIRETYNGYNRGLRRKIKRYEELYNEKLEDYGRSVDEEGPAFPAQTPDDKRSDEDQEFIDDISGTDMGGDLWSGGKKSRKLASRFRKSIAQELGVKRLPNIQEMLSLQVQAGELDPDDDDAVFDAIKRLKNPLHPDTRAMYSLYAQVQNPDLKEEELIEFINGPYKQRVAEFETEEGKKSLEKEWDRRWNEIEDEHKHTGVGDTLSDYWKSLGQTDISMDDFSVPKKPENWNSMSFEEKKDFMENTDFGGAYQDFLSKGETGNFMQGLGWTLDKLLRFNYAVAGMANQWFEADEEPTKPWSEGDPTQQALSVLIAPALQMGLFLGKNPIDSIDDIAENPSKLNNIANEGYQQLFRGSGLPGIEKGTTPITFSQVIKNNADRDGEQNLYDKSWYQHTAGFAADVAFDPTTYVGIGLIGKAGQLSLRGLSSTGRSISDEAVVGLRGVQDYVTKAKYGPLAADAAYIQRAMNRKVGPKEHWLNRMRNPNASSYADTAARTRALIGLEDPTLPISKQIDALAIKERELQEDLASDAMVDKILRFSSESGNYLPTVGKRDLRTETLLNGGGSAAKPIDLHAIGELVRGSADSAGFIKTRLTPEARQAQEQLDALKLNSQGGSFDEQIKTLERSVASGTKSSSDVSRFLKDQQAAEFVAEHGSKLKQRIASIWGVRSDQVPFGEDELLEAVARGPQLLRNDPARREQYDRVYGELRKADRKLEDYAIAKQAGRRVNAKAVARAQKTRQTALDELNFLTAEGTIHYLEQLEKMGRFGFIAGPEGIIRGRVLERNIYSDQKKAKDLLDLRAQITERMNTKGDTSSNITTKEEGVTDSYGDNLGREIENEFWDADLGGSLDEILGNATGSYKDEATKLAALNRAVNNQLKTLKLNKGLEITGVPPIASERILASAPSRFLTKEGVLDDKKLRLAMVVDTTARDTKYARDKVFYGKSAVHRLKDLARNAKTPEAASRLSARALEAEKLLADLTPAENAWLRNVSGYVMDRYNEIYSKRNLAAKSEITGIGVTERANHVFNPDSPPEKFNSVVLGYGLVGKSSKKNTPEWIDKYIQTRLAGKAQRSWDDSQRAGREDFDEFSSTQRNIQRVHEAIKDADANGIPPVVHYFVEKPLDDEVNKWAKQVVDYARGRGVTTYVYRYRGPNHAPERQVFNGAEEAPAKTNIEVEKERVKSPRPKSYWARGFPQGFGSAQEIRERVLLGSREDFYNVLLSPGSPFNITDRKLLQFDDVARTKLDSGDSVKDMREMPAPGQVSFEGEVLPYNLSKARAKIHEIVEREMDQYPKVEERAQKLLGKGRSKKLDRKTAYYIARSEEVVEPFIEKEYAQAWRLYINDLDAQTQVKFFNDVFNGALRNQREAAKKAANKPKPRNYTDTDELTPSLLGSDAYRKLTYQALDEAITDVVEQITTRGSIPKTPHNQRARFSVNMTEKEMMRDVEGQFNRLTELGMAPDMSFRKVQSINSNARSIGKAIKRQFAMKRASLELDSVNAVTKEELDRVRQDLEFLKTQEKEFLKELDIARREAFEAKRIIREDEKAAALLALTQYPGRDLTEDQVRELLAAKRADLEAGNVNRLNEPEIAAEATVHKWYQNMAKIVGREYQKFDEFVTRGSKQLDSDEAREILAYITGGVPLIVRRDLERIDERMGGILTENRKGAFSVLRSGENPSALDVTGGIKQEIDEIVAIFNGTNKDYHFQLEGRPEGTTSFVTWSDMAHWLPKGFMPDPKLLAEAKKKARIVGTDPNGFAVYDNSSGQLTIKDIFDAIPNKANSIYDPAVFAHTYRIAAAQAHSVRIMKDAIGRTFGVPRFANLAEGSAKSREIEALSELGWKTIDELGNMHYFHPEAVKEVQTLVRLITQKDQRDKFGKMIDGAISGWKGLHTTYSPPYYVRGIVGEGLMAWLGGVWNPKYFRRAGHAIKWLRGQDRDVADLMKQLPALDGQIRADVAKGTDTAFTLPKSGFKGSYELAWGLYSKHGLKSAFTNTEVRSHGWRAGAGGIYSDHRVMRNAKEIFNKIHEGGEYFEDYARFAHFLHALEHSGKGSLDEAARYAAKRVRRYHFDYADVSTFEKLVVGRAFPFYKWTRFAAPVMLSHMFLTPGRITAPIKTLDAIAGVLSKSDVSEDKNGHLPDYHGMAPAWVRDLWSYQVSGMAGAEDTYATYIRMATPQLDSLTQIAQPSDAFMALLNPAIKSTLELSINQGLDKDFGSHPIYGGEFNEMYDISNLEATGAYLGRQLGPFAKTGVDIWKGRQETEDGQSYNDYRKEAGYEPWKQLVSNLSGVSVYQAVPGEEPVNELTTAERNETPVGPDEFFNILASGRKAGVSKVEGGDNASKDIGSLLSGMSGYGDNASGRGWIDFGNGNRGYRGRGGGGYGFSNVANSGSLMELLRALAEQIDQGDIVDEGDMFDA